MNYDAVQIMTTGFWAGAAAGAAGTTALNAATYLDMVIRARPTSSTPEDLVEAMADKAGVQIPGHGEQHDNRVQGLGPLFGSGVGIGVGAVAGVCHRALLRKGKRLPFPIAAVLIGATAMALADGPLKAFKISDPADWATADWLADAIPHLVYGIVTEATIRAAESR